MPDVDIISCAFVIGFPFSYSPDSISSRVSDFGPPKIPVLSQISSFYADFSGSGIGDFSCGTRLHTPPDAKDIMQPSSMERSVRNEYPEIKTAQKDIF
jgi:hypothetical protein